MDAPLNYKGGIPLPNYENGDPMMTDDMDEGISGIRGTVDKGRRARDMIQRARGHSGKSAGDAPSTDNGTEPPSAGTGTGQPAPPDSSGAPTSPGGSISNGTGAPTPEAGVGASDGAAASSAGQGGGTVASSAGQGGGLFSGGGAMAGATGGTAAAGGGAVAGGTIAGGAVAGGGAAAGGAAGGAAAGGAAAAGAGGGVIAAVVIGIIILVALIFMPNAAGGNQITHYNDGEVLGTQGPNENGEYAWEDLEYDRKADKESRLFLSEAKRSQELLAVYFESALDDAVDKAKEAVKGIDDEAEIIWDYEGFSPNHYERDHIFKSTRRMNPSLLYVLCAYSVSTNNFVGKDESLRIHHTDVEDEYGDIQSVLELVQRDSEESIFNQGIGAIVANANGDPSGLIIDAFNKVNNGAGLLSLESEDYDYGNFVHGVTIGEPYVETVEVEVEPEEEGGEPTTEEVEKTFIRVTVHDIDHTRICEEAFGYDANDPYEAGQYGEYEVKTTYGETIDDMVTYAGHLILEADGENPAEISFSYGNSTVAYIAPFMSFTGNGSLDMVNTATAYIGNVGGAIFKEWYGLNRDSAWCAAFVSYVANECGYIDAGIIPKFCSCTTGRNWFIEQGQYKSASSGYVPKAGDIVFFSNEKKHGGLSHVGIVTGADSADKVYTVEGNTNNPSNSMAPYGVYKQTRSREPVGTYIVGYGIPNYPTGGGAEGFQSPIGPNWRSVVTSEFGGRTDPITGKPAGHNGMDLACPTGTSIHAALPGTVIIAKYGGSYGNYVKIDHGNGLQTLYAHNSQLLVRQGQTVQGGEIIAKSGSTGRSTGPHCHFEVWLNGARTQPRNYLP